MSDKSTTLITPSVPVRFTRLHEEPHAGCDEEWRPVAGAEGFYSVSNRGRIRSEPIQTSRRGKQRGRVLKGCPDNKGYLQVRIVLPGRRPTTTKVHRAVAIAFLGPRPPGQQINHKSGDKQDNSIENLEYVTCLENVRHAWRLGLCARTHARGENSGKAKLTTEAVIEIRLLKATHSLTQLAQRFAVSKNCISAIVNRETWKHVA